MSWNMWRNLGRSGFLATAFLAACVAARAAEFVISPSGDKVPASRESSRDSASGLREKARAQRNENESAVPLTTIIQELEEDDGPFSGRPGSASTDSNRTRARSFQQGGDGSTSGDLDRLLTDPDSNRGKVKSNLDRARSYQRGDSPGVTNARMGGAENLPLVDCNAQQSVTGRIGDDFAPGSVIIIMQRDKGIKVRCK